MHTLGDCTNFREKVVHVQKAFKLQAFVEMGKSFHVIRNVPESVWIAT